MEEYDPRFSAKHIDKTTKSEISDITVQQYNLAWTAYSQSSSEPEVQALAKINRKQFEYLLLNPLPGYEEECPSFMERMAGVSVEMRTHQHTAAKTIAKGSERNIAARDKIAQMAEVGLQALVGDRLAMLLANKRLPEDKRKPNHQLTWTVSENRMIKTLTKLADYRYVAETYHRVYDDIGEINPLNNLPKGAKLDFGVDPKAILPASVTMASDVHEANAQGEDDFHQRLFRDFESVTNEELEALLSEGKMPDAEKTQRKIVGQEDDGGDLGPKEM